MNRLQQGGGDTLPRERVRAQAARSSTAGRRRARPRRLRTTTGRCGCARVRPLRRAGATRVRHGSPATAGQKAPRAAPCGHTRKERGRDKFQASKEICQHETSPRRHDVNTRQARAAMTHLGTLIIPRRHARAYVALLEDKKRERVALVSRPLAQQALESCALRPLVPVELALVHLVRLATTTVERPSDQNRECEKIERRNDAR